MARIAERDLAQLKQSISVQRLVEGAGVSLTRHGADLIGLCPFHNDREPSLVVSEEKNLWHCLGACQSGGSVIDWVMKAEGVSFRHAVELLQADYQPSAALAAGTVKRSTVSKLPMTLGTDAEDARLLTQVIDYYHETLKQHTQAQAVLAQRGIDHAEAVERFKLGVANRTLGYRLPAKNRKEGAALRGQLQRLGLLRASGHEHFNGSLIIPVIDPSGEVMEVYGRKLNDHLRSGTPKHLYLPGPHRGVFNREGLQGADEVIVCESLIDALTFWCAGYRHVTAGYGTGGFTDDHLAAFKQSGVSRVLIAYDRDAAGDKAAEQLSHRLQAEGFGCYRVQFPKGMDANSYACQVSPASKSLGVVIRSAQWLGEGVAPVRAEAVHAVSASVDDDSTAQVEHTDCSADEASAEIVTDVTRTPSTQTPRPDERLSAAVIPATPRDVPSLTPVNDNEGTLTLGDRAYRVRGLEHLSRAEQLKVNVLVSAPMLGGQAMHVDTFDLYQQRARQAFIQQAAIELGVNETVVKGDLGQLLLAIEQLQADREAQARLKKHPQVTLSASEHRCAMDLLTAPNLIDRIKEAFSRCGMVGESTNALVGYLATLSRKLASPLAVTLQSSSAAGKSSLMDAILNFVPEEERIKYSAMTGQSLFYMGETDLKHKVLAIAEQEGASSAAYALKLLQSEGELTIASTGKDPNTGELKTQDYQVKGPVMILLTTTAIDIDEELLNRCVVLSVDDGREQTQAIHSRQRERRTLSGLLASAERDSLIALHQNAQRLLKPLAVVNPYAQHLTFIDHQTRNRRDHEKYLTLIDTIALLHQHQRAIKQVEHQSKTLRYVEVIPNDIRLANQLAAQVLGRTLDELPPQTRKLLRLILSWVNARCQQERIEQRALRFSRRELREHTHLSDTALKVHLNRLVALEYVVVHRHQTRFYYELVYQGEGEQGEAFLLGLINVEHLRDADHLHDAERSGSNADQSGASQPPGRYGVRGGSII